MSSSVENVQWPRVSFIMPTLNAEALLDNVLASIARQTYPRDRYEIILADAMSKDATREIAPPFELLGLRALYGAVDETVFGVAARAVQIVEWAATHRFCGRCATRTERTPGERAMRCPACGLSAYYSRSHSGSLRHPEVF